MPFTCLRMQRSRDRRAPVLANRRVLYIASGLLLAALYPVIAEGQTVSNWNAPAGGRLCHPQ